ncbi:MAG: N-acetyltransferase [Coprothermobacterota bacterium]|nr:N-acetyltransferase [Coprothermobacterota bacterium]
MPPNVVPLSRKDIHPVAAVLYQAFQHDEPFRRLKHFSATRFPRFFPMIAALFLESETAQGWGYRDHEELAGVALCIPSHWTTSVAHLFRFFRCIRKELGWFAALAMVWDMLRMAVLGRPRRPCFRLLFLAVLPERQGQGIGRILLHHVIAAAPLPRVQLEVEQEKPAVALYRSVGFRKERKFHLGGVDWLVMVRPLAEEQEPN